MDYLKDLKKLIKINSYSHNKKGVDKVGDLMAKWLKELGFEKKVYKRESIGNHLLFTSKKRDGKKILLLGHNDTVFPENYFEEYKEDKEWVYGPGVCDMKGGNIVALQSLRNLFKKNKKIYNIDFLLVSDEEIGSGDSKEISLAIAKNYDYCFVFEAAGKNLELVTARKGLGRYLIKIEGKASHSGTSYMHGINANLEGAIKLQKFHELINLEKGTIVNVGRIEGGIGINTVSPHCDLMMEFRFDKKDEELRVTNEIENIINTSYVEGTKSYSHGIIQRGVMEENENQLELIRFIEQITNDKITVEYRGGISDANIIASCGVTTIDGFGPFGDQDHTIYERALKSSFKQRINMMSKILIHFQNN